ncbi:hypothetical protein ACMHYK_15490 [Candidatus Enterenecus avicola]
MDKNKIKEYLEEKKEQLKEYEVIDKTKDILANISRYLKQKYSDFEQDFDKEQAVEIISFACYMLYSPIRQYLINVTYVTLENNLINKGKLKAETKEFNQKNYFLDHILIPLKGILTLGLSSFYLFSACTILLPIVFGVAILFSFNFLSFLINSGLFLASIYIPTFYKKMTKYFTGYRNDLMIIADKYKGLVSDHYDLLAILSHYNANLQEILNSANGFKEIDFINVDFEENADLGLIIKYNIRANDIIIATLDDDLIKKNNMIAQLKQNSNSITGAVILDGEFSILADRVILDSLNYNYQNKLINMKEYYYKLDSDYSKAFSQLAKWAKEEAEQKAEEERKNFDLKYLKKGYSQKAVDILHLMTHFEEYQEEKETLNLEYQNAFDKETVYTDYYLKIRVNLKGITKNEVPKKAELIGSKIGITPKVLKGKGDDHVFLKFKFGKEAKGRKLKYSDMLEQANKGIINIGATEDGDMIVKYPRADDPFFALVGGISRSGKSTFATRLITGALLLNDNKGFYDYSHVFIGSKKADEDYKDSLHWDKRGMYICSDPEEQYEMLLKVDALAYKQKEIISGAGCVNIKQYNSENPDKKLGKILLIMDEYKNTMTSASFVKIETENGNKKLNDLIEQMLIKINSEHGSRGVNTIVITQSFAKNGMGQVRDTLGSHFLGYADKDVWNSIDPERKISSYLNDFKDSRQGLFMVKAPDFRVADDNVFDDLNGFTLVRTHYHDMKDLINNFDRHFETSNMFQNKGISDVESSISEIETIEETAMEVAKEEVTLETESKEETKQEESETKETEIRSNDSEFFL